MGGHGGLNILPQKRWNVYNFENREKVRKDEEAAAEEERRIVEEQQRRDGEIRRHKLLESARRRREALLESSGGGCDVKDLLTVSGDNAVASSAKEHDGDRRTEVRQTSTTSDMGRLEAGADPCAPSGSEMPTSFQEGVTSSFLKHQVANSSETEQGLGEDRGKTTRGDAASTPSHGANDHINLFEGNHIGGQQGHEASAGEPSQSTHKRGREECKNGVEDERYRLGYGVSRPWYADGRSGSLLTASTKSSTEGGKAGARTGLQAPTTCAPGGSLDGGDPDNRTSRSLGPQPQAVPSAAAGLSRGALRRGGGSAQGGLSTATLSRRGAELDKLRKERLEREQRERVRADKLLAQRGRASSSVGPGGQEKSSGAIVWGTGGSSHVRSFPNNRGYNSGFGFGR